MSIVSDIAHVILTRFNLPSAGVESTIRAQQGWLRERVGLFERYPAPSVQAQGSARVRWVVYFDPESPAWLLEWIERTHRGFGYTPRFRAEVRPEDLQADIRDEVGRDGGGHGHGDVLITTNLDNDDALSVDFACRLQEFVAERLQPSGTHRGTAPSDRLAVYFEHGIIATARGAYRRTDRSNAFCSVVEPIDGAVTCWAAWHNRLHLQMQAHAIGGDPGWLQVVHGSNVSNRVRGVLVDPSRFRSLFGTALDDVPAPTRRTLARDRLVVAPARALKEFARGASKNAVVRIAGTDGLDAMKLRLTRATHRTDGRRA